MSETATTRVIRVVGRETALTGTGIHAVLISGASTLALLKVDNAYPGANGAVLQF